MPLLQGPTQGKHPPYMDDALLKAMKTYASKPQLEGDLKSIRIFEGVDPHSARIGADFPKELEAALVSLLH